MSKEPKRMSEEPSALGASIGAVRAEQPSDERLAALAARLTAAGAAVDFRPATTAKPAAQVTPAPPIERAAQPGRRALGLGILVLGGVGLATWFGVERARPAPQREAGATAVPALPAQPPPSAEQPLAPARAQAPLDAAKDPRATASAPERAAVNPRDAAAQPSAVSAAEPLVAPSAPAHRELAPASPPTSATPAPPATSGSRPARSPSGKVSSQATDTNPGAPLANGNVVTSELALLKEARSALAADPAQAFALTERCRAQYPSGDLAQEREYIAISALVRMGRSSEAASRAALFRMHYPSSAYLPRLARLLGEP